MANRFTRELKDPETGRWSGREIWARVRSGLAVLLSVAVLAGGTWFVYDTAWNAWMSYRTAEDYIGEGVDPIQVTIPKGATLSEISKILEEADVVKSSKTFDEAAAKESEASSIQAGKYNLKTQLPAATALAMLLDPANIVRNRMTLVEGQRLDQMVKTISKASGVKTKKLNAQLKKWKQLGLPTWAKNSAEGFIFPDTYEIPAKPTAKNVLTMATKQFSVVAQELDIEDGAEALGYTPYEILIVASIIEKEAGTDEDRAKVARVIYNRLEQGMKLQLDSTVSYAANESGKVATTAEMRALDSPWNTYVVDGLPKGPISSPSRKSLEAALNPASGSWLYFVTVNLDTGETVFSDTKAEHDAAAARWQQWCTANDENRKKCYG